MLRVEEKIPEIWGRLRWYQTGLVLNNGGATETCKPGRAEHNETTLVLKAKSTASMDEDTVPVLSAAMSNSVIAATMQMDDSGLTSAKALSSEDISSHGRSWEVFIVSLEAMLS